MTRTSSNALYSWSASAGSVAYPINGLNQTGVDGGPLPYDLKGNMLGDGVHAFTYDQANKLRGVTGPATGTLTYDALDRLSTATNRLSASKLWLCAETLDLPIQKLVPPRRGNAHAREFSFTTLAR